jgi:hypothetical protein
MKQNHQPAIAWTNATPREWSECRVKAMFRDNSGAISMQQLAELEVDHYSIPAFYEFGAPAHEDGSTIASNKTLLRGGEILFSKLNCHKPRVWIVPGDDQVRLLPLSSFRSWSGIPAL